MKLIGIVLFAILVAYFYYDRELCFYGRNQINVYHPLPEGIKPDYWGYDMGNLGFVLLDKSGFTLVAKGVKYRSSPVVVDKIIKYGFDQTNLVALVTDSVGVRYELRCEAVGDMISVSVDKVDSQDDGKFTWINIMNDDLRVKMTETIRNYLLIALIMTVLFGGYKLIRRRRLEADSHGGS